jgi:hypothetical protein
MMGIALGAELAQSMRKSNSEFQPKYLNVP